MRIVIARSTDVDSLLFNQVVNFLKGFPGIAILDFPETAIKMISDESENNSALPGFDDFFRKCEGLREFSGGRIQKDDLVVLLSGVSNDQNWFSAFQLPTSKRNIFICTEDWEYYLPESKVHFAIAYQVVENCMQVLMDLNYELAENAPYIHLKSRGCLNDFCRDKRDIILKIQTANICLDCRKKINAYPEALAFQKYALSVMKSVRIELVLDADEGSVEEKKIEMINSDECRLIINKTKLNFSVFWKSIEIANYSMTELSFVFYLTFLEVFALKGLTWVDLNNPEIKKFMIDNAYKKRDKKAIQSLIDQQKFFLERKSLVNRAIKDGFLESYKNQTDILNHLKIGSKKDRNSNTVYSIAFNRKNISFSVD